MSYGTQTSWAAMAITQQLAHLWPISHIEASAATASTVETHRERLTRSLGRAGGSGGAAQKAADEVVVHDRRWPRTGLPVERLAVPLRSCPISSWTPARTASSRIPAYGYPEAADERADAKQRVPHDHQDVEVQLRCGGLACQSVSNLWGARSLPGHSPATAGADLALGAVSDAFALPSRSCCWPARGSGMALGPARPPRRRPARPVLARDPQRTRRLRRLGRKPSTRLNSQVKGTIQNRLHTCVLQARGAITRDG